LIEGAAIINSLVDTYLTTEIDVTDSETDPASTIIEDFQAENKEPIQEKTPVVDEQLVKEFVTEIIKSSSSIVTEPTSTCSLPELIPIVSTCTLPDSITHDDFDENTNIHSNTTGNTSFYSTLEDEHHQALPSAQAHFNPGLTSSFISESGNLPHQNNPLSSSFDLADTTSTHDSDSDEDDLSNKTLDPEATNNNQSLSSSCSFHTAAESVAKPTLPGLLSKHSSTSNSYFTAVEDTNRSFLVASDSSSFGDLNAASLNSSHNTTAFSTCDEMFSDLSSNNSTLADLSGDDLEQQSAEDLGKLSVQAFLNLGPALANAGEESAGSTLTEKSDENEDLKAKKSKLSLLLKDMSQSSPESPSPVEPTSPRPEIAETDSCTSSVLEFESLEIQCSSNESLEDEGEEEERKANFEICHDLNTIYESNDDISQINHEPPEPAEPLASSLSKLSPLDDPLSRSSSTNSVKSNESFETEIKTSVRIDDSSFFVRRPPAPGAAQSPSAPATSLLQPSQNEDSGHSSQIQSPQTNSSEADNTEVITATTNVCLIRQPALSKVDLVNRGKEELKFMSELKRSMAREGGSGRRLVSLNQSTNSSCRQSRTSSSTSSASSSSLSLHERSTVVHIVGQKKLSVPNSSTMSAESLPSFRKQISQAEANKTSPGVNLVTSASFTGSSGSGKESLRLNEKQQTISSPNISGGQHSANCYCHKHVQKVNGNSSNEIKAMLSSGSLKGNG